MTPSSSPERPAPASLAAPIAHPVVLPDLSPRDRYLASKLRWQFRQRPVVRPRDRRMKPYDREYNPSRYHDLVETVDERLKRHEPVMLGR